MALTQEQQTNRRRASELLLRSLIKVERGDSIAASIGPAEQYIGPKQLSHRHDEFRRSLAPSPPPQRERDQFERLREQKSQAAM